MATTIQIKRGTGSAVPSGLEDGELAINLDNGKLFFGSGSTSINSFRFENLTAENYIVSSSVTNITTQELSGSTNFGDTVDDTHTFIGAITASGNISSSGTIVAATLDAAAVTDALAAAIIAEIDNDEIPIAKLAEDAVTVTAGTGLTGGGSITLGGSATVNVIGGTGVTANANDIAIGQDVATTSNVIFNHITASGDISSSGTIIAATLDAAAVSDTLAAAIVAEIDNDEIPIAKLAEDAVTVTAGTGLTGGGSITLGGSATVNVIGGTGVTANANDIAIGQDVATTANVQFANITSSANISASGNIIAVSMSAAAFSGDGSGITNVSAVANTGTYSSSLQILSNITASGDISSSGTITAATLDAAAVSDTLAAAIVAEIDNDEIPIAKLAEDAVTVTAGTGLTGGGSITLGGSATVNVIGGDGITANANDIAITAAQTTITSILAANVKIGEDDETKIDFETADEIHFYANNAQEMVIQANVVAPGADDGTALGDADQRWSDLFLAEGGVINFDNGDVTITQTGNNLAIAGTGTSSFDGKISAVGDISSSGTIVAATLDAAAVTDTLAAAIVAEIDNDEIPIAKLAEDAVTVTAGTGLTGGGSITLGGSATVNVIGGDGIDANANDMAIKAAQTTITSILAANVKIGEDDETKIDFETADEIHFYANNAQEMIIQANVVAPGADDGTALGDANQRWSDLFLAEGGVINFDNGDVTITQTGNNLAIAGTGTSSFDGKISAVGDISSSGTITAATLIGAHTLTTAAQTNITSVGTLSALTVSGDITANGNIVGDDATDITNIESIFCDRIFHDGDTDTSLIFGTNELAIKAGNTEVFLSTITGSVLPNIHQNIFDTGSLAISTANGAMGDIVKFGGTTTTAGGVYFLNSSGGWTLTQANAATTSTGSLAVAVGTNSTTHGMCLRGFVNPFTDPSAGIGSPVYLSDTHTGRILAVPPSDTNDVVRIVGYQYGPDLIYFNPSNDFIIHA